MTRLITTGLLLFATLSVGLDVSAHPGHSHHAEQDSKSAPTAGTTNRTNRQAHERTWTVQQSGREIDGSLLLSKDGQLRLEQRDGSVLTIPLRDLKSSDRLWAERRLHGIRQLNSQSGFQLLALQSGRREPSERAKPSIAGLFDPFRKHVQVRWDEQFLYVESDGMPDHAMMIGITAWQQQVPLPQRYTGNNAWRIPLNPVPAKQPMSAKTGFFRGAIALAVNGVPIFNPIKNDGRTDTLKAGELDEWGGHCGRADDYHYHIAPVHLEKIVGKGTPVAFSLDGYPIYGYVDTDGSTPKDLDWLNGHKSADGSYHYHATKTYPYLNGGFYGRVVERGGQVDPQPRAGGVRPAQRPLRGARITGFKNPSPNRFSVEYDVYGDKRSISYDVADDGSAKFRFTDSSGTKTEEYQPRRRVGDGGRPRNQVAGRENQGDPRPDVRGRNNPPPQGGERRRRGGGDPIMRAFDTNRDGEIDRAELEKAAEVLRSLDRNGDGQLTSDELRGGDGQEDGPREDQNRGQGGGKRGGQNRPGGNRPQGQAGGSRGPQPGNGPRQPWILVHAEEVDLNEDGIISRDEIVGEAKRAFGGYDQNNDDKLVESELNSKGNVRSAMGGFIRGHASELDRDRDGFISKDEVLNNAIRMFDRVDRNSDGKVTKNELQSATRSSDARPRQGGTQGKDRQPGRTSAVPRAVPVTPGARSQSDRPNFVFVLIDDMGWKDMGFCGNEFVETPNADRLAREGIIFTQAYASAPNCAPTRACLLSGQYPPRHGLFTVVDERHAPGQPHHRILASPSNESMSGDVVTIPESLKAAGYAAGCFGMWNLGRGRFGPSTATGQGFDVYKKPQDLGFNRSSYIDNEGRYLTDVLFDEGIRFIENNAETPFFLYLPTHAIHAPFEPKPDLLRKYKRKAEQTGRRNADPTYAAMIEAVDQNLGRLMQTLRRLNIADNTMVIFTSDNGGTPRYVAPLNGSKGALYEGGIRVPAFVWWSKIKQPGRTSSEPIASIDFFPTFLEAAGLEPPSEHPLDGISLVPLLKDSRTIKRGPLFWHFPCYIGKSSPCSAIRMGDYKLIEFFEDRHVELYNLRDDIGETKDLSQKMAEKAKQLHRTLINWRISLKAPVPDQPNPEFDPNSIRGRRKGQRRGGGNRRRAESRPSS